MRCREGGKWRGFPFDIMLFLRKVRSSDERKAGGSEITGEWKSRKALLSKRGTPADHTHTKDDRLAVTGVPLSCPW